MPSQWMVPPTTHGVVSRTLEKRSCCELEVDACVEHVLNRSEASFILQSQLNLRTLFVVINVVSQTGASPLVDNWCKGLFEKTESDSVSGAAGEGEAGGSGVGQAHGGIAGAHVGRGAAALRGHGPPASTARPPSDPRAPLPHCGRHQARIPGMCFCAL